MNNLLDAIGHGLLKLNFVGEAVVDTGRWWWWTVVSIKFSGEEVVAIKFSGHMAAFKPMPIVITNLKKILIHIITMITVSSVKNFTQ